MSLTTAAKDYIANHFGVGSPKCFVSSGISYTDPKGLSETGSTQDVVATLKFDPFGSGLQRGPNGEKYANIPDYQSITDTDVISIGNMQSGASKYCVSASPPPSDKPTTGPFEVTIAEGTQCPPGSPAVILDVTGARAYFKTSPILYVGVMGIDVTNVNQGNDCFGYFVWEMRMWKGAAGTTCPTTAPEIQRISRFLATKSDWKTMTPQLLGTNQKDMVAGSFEIPAGTSGKYTLCLSLWGNHDKQALLDELAIAGYPEKVAWI